jgi:amino acid permease
VRTVVGSVLLFVHIVAAAIWLGANVTQIVVNPALRSSGGQAAAAWVRQTVSLGRIVKTPAAVLILISGFWIVFREDLYTFEQLFVAIGIATVVVGTFIGMRISGPGGRQAADHHENGDEAAAAQVHSRLDMWLLVESMVLVFAFFAMVQRLGI